MKNKILIGIYVLVAGIIIYWAYPIIKERYFSPQEPKESTEEKPKKNGWFGDESEDDWNEDVDVDEQAEDESEEAEVIEEPEYLEVTKEDCDNQCSEFTESADIEYCKQVCGLIPVPSKQSEESLKEGCDDLSELQKDYCLKDKAINEKSFDTCKKISDTNIKKTCENRIVEEIFNGAEE